MATSQDGDPIRVGIGLIRRGGAYLIRRRPPLPGSPMPGVWEFPGGKCEPGESPGQAAARECEEETGLTVILGTCRRVVSHRYPHGFVELHYFDAEAADPSADPSADSGFRWVPVEELPGLTFPEANGPILDDLARLAQRS
ncbi:(deoxy)nucleoside triphosphate pyrophosphohydrolase [Tautonia sp. JC769]|uniref:(deoxy)nucleoside triphosphate pyrophosphohydrolase n=1 Tax=Tautonia sp. JC769 TaxID=3232135 RepID=UPI00345B345E